MRIIMALKLLIAKNFIIPDSFTSMAKFIGQLRRNILVSLLKLIFIYINMVYLNIFLGIVEKIFKKKNSFKNILSFNITIAPNKKT